MLAQLTPQEAVLHFKGRPADCDIVIVILAARLGTILACDVFRRPDGSTYRSGTEWEYEDAWNAVPRPDILVYRRTDVPPIGLEDPDRGEKLRQYELVEQFFDRFKNADGSWKGGFQSYEGVNGFKAQFANDVKYLVVKRLEKLASSRDPELARRLVCATEEANARHLYFLSGPAQPISDSFVQQPVIREVKLSTPRKPPKGDKVEVEPLWWDKQPLTLEAPQQAELLRYEERMSGSEFSFDVTEEVGVDDLFQRMGRSPHLVLVGPPGCGKSTILQWLAWRCARGELPTASNAKLIPARLRLSDLRNWIGRNPPSAQIDLPDFLCKCPLLEAPTEEGIGIGRSQWAEWSIRGEVLLMLDGLDEVGLSPPPSDTSGQHLLRWLANLHERYSKCPIVITCRTADFEAFRQHFVSYSIYTPLGLTWDQIVGFVQRYPFEGASVDSTSVTDMLLRHRQLRPLAANPQILNLICLIATHGLSDLETRSQIYDLALYELCQRSNRPLPEYPTGWEVSPPSSGGFLSRWL